MTLTEHLRVTSFILVFCSSSLAANTNALSHVAKLTDFIIGARDVVVDVVLPSRMKEYRRVDFQSGMNKNQ